MMIRRVFHRLLIFSCLTPLLVSGQDPEFSQFYANPLYLNPALAGGTICPRLIGNYRNQWPAMGNAFITYNASYDQYVDFVHGGIGALVTADRTGGGNLNTTSISLQYAYKFKIARNLFASAGLQAGFLQRTLDWENLRFSDTLTYEDPPESNRVSVPDFSGGVMVWYDELFFAGFAVSHLSEPKTGFYAENDTKLYRKYTLHAGSVIRLRSGSTAKDREFSISPNILYQQQFKYHQLNLGLSVTASPFIGGLWFRHNFENPDALIPFVGIEFQGLRAGFSYDWNISRLGNASGGAYEVSVSYQFPCVEKRRVIKAIKCPRF